MREILDSQFDECVTNAKGPKLVWFCSPACAPCKTLAPILDLVGAQYPRVAVLKMDIAKGHEIAQRYGVMMVPTLFFIHSGMVLAQRQGAPSERELKEMFLYLNSYLNP